MRQFIELGKGLWVTVDVYKTISKSLADDPLAIKTSTNLLSDFDPTQTEAD